MTTKLKALHEVNEKINKIQSMYQVKMKSEEGISFNFDIPESEFDLQKDFELSDGSLYKRIKLYNFNDKTINLILYYGKQHAQIKKHNHEEPHIVICVEGKINIDIDGKVFIIRKGQSIFVNSQQWHNIKFMESSKIIFIYI